jgi:hypothetical protein
MFNIRYSYIIIFLILSVPFFFSFTQIDSCQDINESYIDGDKLVLLNQSISDFSSTFPCMALTASNFTFDCQGNIIDGVHATSIIPYGVYIGGSNVSVKNCIITDFEHGLVGDGHIDNFTFSSNDQGTYQFNNGVINNSFFINNGYGIGFGNDNTSVYNSYFENNQEGVRLSSSSNNYFENITLFNNSQGINFASNSHNNSFIRINLNSSTLFEINIDDTIQNNTNNIFNDSYLGNFSKISNTNWSLNPTFFNRNIFLEGSYPINECFDLLNLTCNNFNILEINEVSKSSLFPFSSIPSLIFITFIYFLLN